MTTDDHAKGDRADEARAQVGIVGGQVVGGLSLLGDHGGADLTGGVGVGEYRADHGERVGRGVGDLSFEGGEELFGGLGGGGGGGGGAGDLFGGLVMAVFHGRRGAYRLNTALGRSNPVTR